MRFFLFATLILLGINRSVVAQETKVPAPKVRVFSSDNGRWSFKVEVTPEKEAKSPALGTLMSWNDDGTSKIIWQHPLPNIPDRAMVFDGPPLSGQYKDDHIYSVVTIGNWGYTRPSTWQEGSERHAVVTYGPDGIIWDYSIPDLMTPQQREEPSGTHRNSLIYRLTSAVFNFSVPAVPDQPFGATHMRMLYNRAVLQVQFPDKQMVEIPLTPYPVGPFGAKEKISGLKWIPPLLTAP